MGIGTGTVKLPQLFCVILGLGFSLIANAQDIFDKKCLEGVCVGDEVYAIRGEANQPSRRRADLASIINIEEDQFVLRFKSSATSGEFQSGWKRESLAVTKGCTTTKPVTCVGEKLLVRFADNFVYSVEVVGIQHKSKMDILIRDSEGRVFADLQSNEEIFYRNSGAGEIGALALNKKRDSVRVKIVGINSLNKFAITLLEGPHKEITGSGWERKDLAIISSNPVWRLYKAQNNNIYCGVFDKGNEFIMTVDYRHCSRYTYAWIDGHCNIVSDDEKREIIAKVDPKSCPKNPVTVDQINFNIRLPEGTHIILAEKFVIPRNTEMNKGGCGAPPRANTNDIQCFLCRSKDSANDTMYNEQGIVLATKAEMTQDKKLVEIMLPDSEDVNSIKCFSKAGRELSITSLETLREVLKTSGFDFKDGGTVTKTLGKVAEE